MTVRAVFFDVFGTLMPYKNLPRHEVLAKRANLVGVSLTPKRLTWLTFWDGVCTM